MKKRLRRKEDILQEDYSESPKPPKKRGGILKILKIFFGLLIVFILISFAVFFFSGKSNLKEEENTDNGIHESVINSPVPIGVMSSDLNNIVNKDDKLDEIVIEKIESIELDKRHKEIVGSKVSGNAKPFLLHVDALGKSVSYDMSFQYELLYVKISKDWHLLFSQPLNQNEWDYIPTEGVKIGRVRETLQELTFPGFEEGFIGDMETSVVEIKNSELDIKNKRELVDLEIKIETDFANYTLKEEVPYIYVDNEWVIENDYDLINNDSWDIDYLTKEKPESHSKEYIMGLVSNEDSYFSKVVNLENAKSYSLNQPSHIPSQFGIGLRYGLNVEYEDLAVITYDILVPVEWTGASWVDKDTSIDIGSAVFNNMLGIWFAKETGDIIILTDVSPFISKGGKKMQNISGMLFEKQEDLSLTDKEITITPEVPLRADAFAGKIGKIEKSDFSEKEIVYNITNSTMVIDDIVFKKADKFLGYKKDIDVEKLLKDADIIKDTEDNELDLEEENDDNKNKDEDKDEDEVDNEKENNDDTKDEDGKDKEKDKDKKDKNNKTTKEKDTNKKDKDKKDTDKKDKKDKNK